MTKPNTGCRTRRAEPPTDDEVRTAHANIKGFVLDGDALAEVHHPMDVVAEMLYAAALVAINNGVCCSCFVELFGIALKETSKGRLAVRVHEVRPEADADTAETVH